MEMALVDVLTECSGFAMIALEDTSGQGKWSEIQLSKNCELLKSFTFSLEINFFAKLVKATSF